MAIRLLLFLAVLLFSGAVAAGNRLADSPSLYLRSHAADPVHWRTWGEAAFNEAREAGKPVFLSIGYASCRWCHVMQRESFAVKATADILNAHFVPVLVDREELPEVDAVYQRAALAWGEPGGWPLTMFLLPDGKPFAAGGYFPDEARLGYPAFRDVLKQAAAVFETGREGVDRMAGAISRALAAQWSAQMTSGALEKAFDLPGLAGALLQDKDPFAGGFGETQKFPEAENLNLLWRAGIRYSDTEGKNAVLHTLRAMNAGALFDQVGGGYFRYTVDPHWNVPHYEKMLDVNAMMLGVLTEVWRETGDPSTERALRETAGFLLGTLRLADGALAASLDAQSPDPEGKSAEGAYYTWDEAALAADLGKAAAAVFSSHFRIALPDVGESETPRGFGPIRRLDERGHLPSAALALLARLKIAQSKRPRPRLDEKVVAAWNGLAIAALAEAGTALKEGSWLMAAETTFNAVEKALADGNGDLARSATGGRQGGEGRLDDYGAMLRAALTLHEITGDGRYLDRAKALAAKARINFMDADGHGFFMASATDAALLPARPRPIEDNPAISGNALMVEGLARLYHLTGETGYRDDAAAAVALYLQWPHSSPRGAAGMVNAADTLRNALQVVIVGERGNEATGALLNTVWRLSLPGRVVQVAGSTETLPQTHPAWGKAQMDAAPTAYVCRGTFCSLPVAKPDELETVLRALRKDARNPK